MQMVLVVLDAPLSKLGMVKTAFANLAMQDMKIASYVHLIHFLTLFVPTVSVLIQIKFLHMINFLVIIVLQIQSQILI